MPQTIADQPLGRWAAARDAGRFYGRCVGASVRSQMQYRASFLMLTAGHFVTIGIEFVGVWALFARFSHLRGWTLPEAALLYGMVHIAFALAEGLARGFDVFPGMIRSGEFDRLLLRPRAAALQVAASQLQLMRLGRLIQGLIVLLWAASRLNLNWSPGRVSLVVAAIAGGACIFAGLFILSATMAFWTIDSLEIVNCVTYGGVETAQFPLAIYKSWFRRFFTFVVPLACINYFPALAILGRATSAGVPAWTAWLSPALGVLFLVLTLQVWKLGVRHYNSTGS